MVESVLVSWGLIAGIDLRVMILISLAIWMPTAAACLLFFHIYRNRRKPSTRSATFCQAMARELRAGSGLRPALEASIASVGAVDLVERIRAGEPLGSLAPMFRNEFPEIGVEVETIVNSVAISGAASAPLFSELGDIALAQVELAEEIRIATSPARASASILVGLPTLYLGYQLISGRFESLLGTPLQQGLTIVGIALILFGILVSFAIVRKSA